MWVCFHFVNKFICIIFLGSTYKVISYICLCKSAILQWKKSDCIKKWETIAYSGKSNSGENEGKRKRMDFQWKGETLGFSDGQMWE